MPKQEDKDNLYRVGRFSVEQLEKLSQSVVSCAQAIGGLPKNHQEVFEKRGWLLPYLFSYDDLLWGRWAYWTDILQKGSLEGSGPIPKIEWKNNHSKASLETVKMLENCLNHHDASIDSFSDWLLWGMAASNEVPRISEKLNEHYYRKFDLFLVLDNPYDHMSYLLCDQTGKGYKSGLGYFPTPFSVAEMLVEMTNLGGDREDLKRKTVLDPSVGCGALLLPASNYYLRGYAQDISSIALKLCRIQMYWYAPWYACPGEVSGFDAVKPIQLVPATANKNVSSRQLAFSF
ncbi:type I restriction-modification system subunit M [Paenibacillus sp. Leaf72]|uniref:type I restriction-modification system subunit M n=1 Tax=Paenibacillus sp. Leaf72 TaxID=1736234 RepID=UPI0006F3E23A|nr:type I restriction-modification system subunit M [Paenibacillus sp. Leaf72]KQN96848.1 hypothetical protein ASF12_22525 [Paenibacillus sp. Leaf72]